MPAVAKATTTGKTSRWGCVPALKAKNTKHSKTAATNRPGTGGREEELVGVPSRQVPSMSLVATTEVIIAPITKAYDIPKSTTRTSPDLKANSRRIKEIRCKKMDRGS